MDMNVCIHVLLAIVWLIPLMNCVSNGTNVPNEIGTPLLRDTRTVGNCIGCVIALGGATKSIKCDAIGTVPPYNMTLYIGSTEIKPWSISDFGLQAMYKATLDDHYKMVFCKSYYDFQSKPMVTFAKMFVTVMPTITKPVLTLSREGNFPPNASCSTPSAFRPSANLTVTITGVIDTWKKISTNETLRNIELSVQPIRRKWFGETIKCCLQHFIIRTYIENDTVCVQKLLNFTTKNKEPETNDTVQVNTTYPATNPVTEESTLNPAAIVLPILAVVMIVTVIVVYVFVKKRKPKPNLLDSQVSHDVRISAELNRETSGVYNSAQSIGSFRTSDMYNSASDYGGSHFYNSTADDYGGSHVYNSAYSTGKASDSESTKYEQMMADSQGRLSSMNITDVRSGRNTVTVPSYEALDRAKRTDNNYAKLQAGGRHSYIYMIGAKHGTSEFIRPPYEMLDKSQLNMNNAYTPLHSETDRQSFTDMLGHKADTSVNTSTYEQLERSNRNIPNASSYEPLDRSNRTTTSSSSYEPLDRSNRNTTSSSSYEPLDRSNRTTTSSSSYEPLDRSNRTTTSSSSYEPLDRSNRNTTSSSQYEPLDKRNRTTTSSSSYEALDRSNIDTTSSSQYEPLDSTNRNITSQSSYEPLDRSNRNITITSLYKPLDRSTKSFLSASANEPLGKSNRNTLTAPTYDILDNYTITDDKYDSIPPQRGRLSYIHMPSTTRPVRGATPAYEALDRTNIPEKHTYEPLQSNNTDYENLNPIAEQ